MNLLSSMELENKYLNSKDFKMLYEKENSMRDNLDNTALMYLCKGKPNLLNHDIFTTMFKQQCGM